MSCPMNSVRASWPCTWFTRKLSLMCILLKSPVRSWTVTSAMRPTSFDGSSARVSPTSCLLNISGARRLYQTLDFHLSLIFLAAARVFFSAMRATRRGGGYLRVPGERSGAGENHVHGLRGPRVRSGPARGGRLEVSPFLRHGLEHGDDRPGRVRLSVTVDLPFSEDDAAELAPVHRDQGEVHVAHEGRHEVVEHEEVEAAYREVPSPRPQEVVQPRELPRPVEGVPGESHHEHRGEVHEEEALLEGAVLPALVPPLRLRVHRRVFLIPACEAEEVGDEGNGHEEVILPREEEEAELPGPPHEVELEGVVDGEDSEGDHDVHGDRQVAEHGGLRKDTVAGEDEVRHQPDMGPVHDPQAQVMPLDLDLLPCAAVQLDRVFPSPRAPADEVEADKAQGDEEYRKAEGVGEGVERGRVSGAERFERHAGGRHDDLPAHQRVRVRGSLAPFADREGHGDSHAREEAHLAVRVRRREGSRETDLVLSALDAIPDEPGVRPRDGGRAGLVRRGEEVEGG